MKISISKLIHFQREIQNFPHYTSMITHVTDVPQHGLQYITTKQQVV